MALTAPPEAQALLLDLQRIDTELQRIAHRARTLPEQARLDELTALSPSVREALVERENALDDARLELSRVESDVELVEKRIARDEGLVQQSSSVKDIAGLEHEVASLKTRLADLEEIELAIMEKVETLESEVADARSALAAHETAVAAATQARDEALGTLARDRDNQSADRADVAGRIPADLLALYEKQRERYGVGASHLRARISSASGVELTGNDLAAVRAAAPDAVILCPDSNAILVRTAESGL
ncbi:zinc ribbon domain-containing protein [Microcella sp.]|uniref:zinc ribbon domain-containing protein n=1 Tax=Microcella sp. TaxID=1913979 RepID=UPI00391B36C7